MPSIIGKALTVVSCFCLHKPTAPRDSGKGGRGGKKGGKRRHKFAIMDAERKE